MLVEPGSEARGLRRAEPVELGQLESPDVALVQGEPWVVAIAWEDKEKVLLFGGGTRELLWEGARAWHPQIAAGPEGEVWLAWCGREEEGPRGTLNTDIWLMKRGGEPRVVSSGEGRDCDPDLLVDGAGRVHLAWESEGRIATWSEQRGEEAHGEAWLARRPAVVWSGDTLWLAWDEFSDTTPTGARDPRTRVVVRQQTSTGWGGVRLVDAPDGIAAAPRLLPHPDGVMVAYHRSLPMGIVKWPRLRLVTAKGVLEAEPVEVPVPQGENQGAEFPEPVLTVSGGVVMLSRSSQGALVTAGAQGWDLTRKPWGARGIRASAVLRGDTLFVARKARTATVLEELTLPPIAAPLFHPVEPTEPERLEALPPGSAPWFGDVHMHSAIGDCTGPPDEVYARARVRGLDFAIMTEHDFVLGSRLLPSEQEEIAWLTERFDSLPGFTTLHAYEWTTPPLFRDGDGHRNAYFRGSAPSPVPGHKGSAPDSGALWEALRGEQVFTAPHHTTWTGTHWEQADPEIQRHLEIISVHGLNEAPWQTEIPSRGDQEEGFASVGLQSLRFGFLGGSDAHGLLWHHGIGRKEDPWACGLTGVIAPENSREALWDALYARHSFATSGSRTVALFRSGEAMNGDVIPRPDFTWEARGTALSEVSIVRDGEVVETFPVSGSESSGSWSDSKPGRTYYLRVVDQVDGLPELAWSSPLFVETP